METFPRSRLLAPRPAPMGLAASGAAAAVCTSVVLIAGHIHFRRNSLRQFCFFLANRCPISAAISETSVGGPSKHAGRSLRGPLPRHCLFPFLHYARLP